MVCLPFSQTIDWEIVNKSQQNNNNTRREASNIISCKIRVNECANISYNRYNLLKLR